MPSWHLPGTNQTPFRNRPRSFFNVLRYQLLLGWFIGLQLKYPWRFRKKSYLQGIQELCQSERIFCQTSILTHLLPLSLLMIFLWEIEKVISVTVSFPWKLLKKFTCKKYENDANCKRFLVKHLYSRMQFLALCWYLCDFSFNILSM